MVIIMQVRHEMSTVGFMREHAQKLRLPYYKELLFLNHAQMDAVINCDC